LGWEIHADPGSDSGLAGYSQFAADQFGHSARDCKTDTESGIRPLHRIVALMKGLEDRIDFVLLNANAGIRNLDLDTVTVRRRMHLNRDLSLGCKLDCVVKHILENAFDFRAVTHQWNICLRKLNV
jgi:hypothetical protein